MATAETIIRKALSRLGVLGAAQSPSGQDMEFCLQALNDIVDQWSAQSTFAYQIARLSFTTIPGVGVYTIGPGAAVQVNPTPAGVFDTLTISEGGTVYELSPLDEGQFAAIRAPAQLGMPQVYNYAPTTGLGILRLWPIPDSAYSVTVPTGQPVSTFSDNVGQDYALAPGYALALDMTLSEHLQEPYGRQLSAQSIQMAKNARAIVRRNNLRIGTLDPGFGGDGFNILTNR